MEVPCGLGAMEGGSPEAMGEYVRLKKAVDACINTLEELEHADAQALADLKEKLHANVFNLVTVGQFKRGKTCLINALLGAELLPVAVVPLTSIVTVITFGDSLRIKVFFRDGRETEIEAGSLAGYVTEQGNPRNIKDVREVVIAYPSPYLREGVRLIDTPGVGSLYQHNTDVAYQYLPKSDAVLFVLSVEQPVGRAELDFLKDIRQYSDKIFFLLNKIDYFTEQEVGASVAFSRETLREVMDSDVSVFPVSARLALDGQLQGSPEMLAKSRLPAFSQVLNHFLMHEKGKVFLVSLTNGLARMISRACLEIEIELQAIKMPLEELKERIAIFQNKKQEILKEKEDLDILLQRDVDRLVTDLDADLKAFKTSLVAQMEERLDALYREHEHLPLKELDEVLNRCTTEQVEQAFTAWRATEDERLGQAFDAVCRRFLDKVDEIAHSLVEFSSELFAVSTNPVRRDSQWARESGHYYKYKEEAVGLELLSDSLTQILPGLVHSRFKKLKEFLFRMAHQSIFKKRKANMLQMLDRQHGRLRYDFVERLNKSRMQFYRNMLEIIETTVLSIVSAAEKGTQQRYRGEKEAQARDAVLAEELEQWNRVSGELMDIRAAARGL